MHNQINNHPFTGMLNPNTLNSRSLRIALLEDNTDHTQRVQDYIVNSGSQCTVYHGVTGLQDALRKVTYDVVMFDWDRSVCLNVEDLIDWIRNTQNSDVPVIVTSKSTCEHTIVDALYSGVDTFLVKPLRQSEFLARLHALVRRVQPEYEVFTCPPYSVNVPNREVKFEDEVVPLTHLEYELALFLFRNCGRVLSRRQLLASIWHIPNLIDTRTIDTHISRLRSKLKIRDTRRWVLASVYRQGYCIEQQIDAR